MKNIQPIPKKKNWEQNTTEQSAKNDILFAGSATFGEPRWFPRRMDEVYHTNTNYTKLSMRVTQWVSDGNSWLSNLPIGMETVGTKSHRYVTDDMLHELLHENTPYDVGGRNSWLSNWPIRVQSGDFKYCCPERVDQRRTDHQQEAGWSIRGWKYPLVYYLSSAF